MKGFCSTDRDSCGRCLSFWDKYVKSPKSKTAPLFDLLTLMDAGDYHKQKNQSFEG